MSLERFDVARILLVDDEPAFRQLAQSWLQNSGYQVQTAADGVQQLQLAIQAAGAGLHRHEFGAPAIGIQAPHAAAALVLAQRGVWVYSLTTAVFVGGFITHIWMNDDRVSHFVI